MLQTVNPRKAADPDGIPGCVLRNYAELLVGVFPKIFNLSLSKASVPSIPFHYLKHQPQPLTCVCLSASSAHHGNDEVLSHIMSFIPPTIDVHQSAYRANRSTEDAVAVPLHVTLSHLEKQRSYAHLLCIDFSSDFHTILYHRLVYKLLALGLLFSTCIWTNDFQTQRVRVGPRVGPTSPRPIASAPAPIRAAC